MEAALKQVMNKELSLREAAAAHSVPKSTLARRVSGKNKFVTGGNKHLGRFLTDFPPEYEDELANYIQEMPVSLGLRSRMSDGWHTSLHIKTVYITPIYHTDLM